MQNTYLIFSFFGLPKSPILYIIADSHYVMEEEAEFSLEVEYLTKDIQGIGGIIKSEPEHFSVEEIPAYEPCGSGEHVYISITREGMTSTEIVEKLGSLFKLQHKDIGFAGLKDKHAKTTQTFSILIHDEDLNKLANSVEENLKVKVNWFKRHKNKLKPGHLKGNKFRILVLHPNPERVIKQAEIIKKVLLVKGVPNYFGVQRFGLRGHNPEEGKAILFGNRKYNKWLNKFLISAYQSQLFNFWLSERVSNGLFEKVLDGDVAIKEDSHGAFLVENQDAEQKRFDMKEISFTGPIFGYRMKKPKGISGEAEQRIFDSEGLDLDILKKAGLKGSRRSGRLLIDEISISKVNNGLMFEFTLPKAAYATSVLREFMKTGGL